MHIVETRIAKERFLEVFRECGVLRPALEAASIPRGTLSSWLERDVEFTVRFHEAEKDAADFLEMVALRRACGGKVPSDRLLLALLRARDPARWRDSFHLEAPDGLAITYTNDWRPRDDAAAATQPGTPDSAETGAGS